MIFYQLPLNFGHFGPDYIQIVNVIRSQEFHLRDRWSFESELDDHSRIWWQLWPQLYLSQSRD